MTLSRSEAATAGRDSRIATGLLVLVFAIILAGFAKNFYLRAWLGTRPLILTAWLHGIVMTAWLTLFAVQVIAVATNRVDLHRRIGRWGAWLAPVVVAVGTVTIVVRTRLLYPDATLWTSALVFVAFDGLSLLLFGVLVAMAWRYRQRPASHRRLMTMALVALLPPAFGRLVAYFRHEQVEITVLALMALTAVLFVVVDRVRSRRLHAASWVPALSIVLVNCATYLAQVSS